MFSISVAFVPVGTFVHSINFCTKFELQCFLSKTERKTKARWLQIADEAKQTENFQ
jgi:hypothetical protein